MNNETDSKNITALHTDPTHALHRLRRKLRRERILWMSLLAISFGVQLLFVRYPLRAEESDEQRHQHTLQKLLYYMENYYVEDLGREALLEGAIRGVLNSARDPYTRYLNPEQLKRFSENERGERVGIGVEVDPRENPPVILKPIESGPALRAGLQAGDVIETIDERKTTDLNFSEIVDLISGERGSVVKLGIRRNGHAGVLSYQIVRDVFTLNYVHAHFFDEQNVGYIRLTQFFGEEKTVQEFYENLKSIRERHPTGLIVDLRGNGGGRVQMAAVLAGYFLEKDAVVTRVRGRLEGWNRDIRTGEQTGVLPDDISIVILVDANTASAAEIFAGALQDYKRAVLIGATTYGKGSVQRVFRPLPDHGAALITIQKYFTPNNRVIHGRGLRPDIEVQSGPSEAELFYYSRMVNAHFLRDFQSLHPEYSNNLVTEFRTAAADKGWPISPDTARLWLKQMYRVEQFTPDPEVDSALRRALEQLQNSASGTNRGNDV